MITCNRKTADLSVLVIATICATIRTALIIAPHFCKSVRFDSASESNKWSTWHRNWALVHYAVLYPLFEIFIIWGFAFMSIELVSAEIIMLWLSVVSTSVILQIVCAVTKTGYRKTIYIIQVMEIPCMVAFICERLLLDKLNPEFTLPLGILFVTLVEVFTMPDFMFGKPTQPKLARSPNSFQKFQSDENVGDEAKSHALVELSIERRLSGLIQMIEEANEKTMDLNDLKNFVKICKANVNSMTDAKQVSSPGTPRSALSGSGTDYVVSPTLPDLQMNTINADHTMPIGVGERYNRRRQTNEKPEC